MYDKTLKQALDFANITILPKAQEGAYRTRSICLVKKTEGDLVYCIGVYDEKEGRTVILKDFSKGCGYVEEVLSVHPIKEKEQKQNFDFTALTEYEMREWLDKNNIVYFDDSKKGLIKAYWRYKKSNNLK